MEIVTLFSRCDCVDSRDKSKLSASSSFRSLSAWNLVVAIVTIPPVVYTDLGRVLPRVESSSVPLPPLAQGYCSERQVGIEVVGL